MPVLPGSITDQTLQLYLTDLQRLLHDSSFKFWSQLEMIEYINKARKKVAAETGCNRQLVSGAPLSSNIGAYDFTQLISTRRVVGALDVYVNYSESYRPPLFYLPYSDFARTPVVISKYQGTPQIWSQLGNIVYIAPKPSTDDYTIDIDLALEPASLVDLSDVDSEVLPPFSECVKFVAAYFAKIKDQRRQEANDFLGDYIMERNSVLSSTMIRKLVGR